MRSEKRIREEGLGFDDGRTDDTWGGDLGGEFEIMVIFALYWNSERISEEDFS